MYQIDCSRHKSKLVISFIGFLLITLFTINSQAASSCITPPSNMVGWWTGDNTANDSISNNNGSLMNGAGYGVGMVGEAFKLDGIDDYVRLQSSSKLIFTKALSIDAWIYPVSVPDYSIIAARWDVVSGVDQRSFVFELTPSSEIQFRISPDGSGDVVTVISNKIIPKNQWTHLAGVWDGYTMKLYINGKLDNQIAYTGAIFNGSQDMGVGALVGSFFNHQFHGSIDEVEVFNRALTESEIQSIFNTGAAGKCKPGSFASFNSRVEMKFGSKPNDDAFAMVGDFKLSNESDGINPITEKLTLDIGSFSVTAPPRSFRRNGHGFKYINKAKRYVIWIQPRSNHHDYPLQTKGSYESRNTFTIFVKANALDLNGTVLPPAVRLVIGDDQGGAKLDIGKVIFMNKNDMGRVRKFKIRI